MEAIGEKLALFIFYASAVMSAFINDPFQNPIQTVRQQLLPDSIVAQPIEETKVETDTDVSEKGRTQVQEIAASSASTPKVRLTPSPNMTFMFDEEVGELHAYDLAGRHTGPVMITYESHILPWHEEHIPGAYYREVGSNAFISYPRDIDGYIELRGVQSGIDDFVISAENKTIGVYPGVKLEKGSRATFPIEFIGKDDVSLGPLSIDRDGNGTIDEIIHASNR